MSAEEPFELAPLATLPPAHPELAQLELRLRRAEEKLQAIQQISHLSAATTDREGLVATITRRIAAVVECERVTLWLVEPADLPGRSPSDAGLALVSTLATPDDDAPAPRKVALPIGRGLAGWVAEHNRPINVKDAYKDARFDPSVDEQTGFRTRSAVCLPLVDHEPWAPGWVRRPAIIGDAPTNGSGHFSRHGVLGVLQALNKRDGYFSPTDEALLRACADQAALLLRQQRLFHDLMTRNIELLDLKFRLEERTAEMELMFDVERAAAVARDLDEALGGALERTLVEFPCELATVILVDRGDVRTSFTARRTAGAQAERLPPQVLGLDRLVVSAAVHGQIVTHSEWDRDELERTPLLERLMAKTFAAIPIARAGEAPVGALILVNPSRVPRGFDDHDIHKLSVIASRIALSVVLATAMEEERKAERLAAIGGALSSVVHDLRTPLTLLSGYARLLEREEDNERRRELRELHKRQVEQLQVMIREILSFAKGQKDLFLRKVWVRDLLSDLEELLRAELAEAMAPEADGTTGVTLVIDAAYRGAVRADDAKLKRALLNLAKNAREAMGERGGTLTISVSEESERVVFRVSDTGPGIPPEMEGRLFQSFATHGKESGTGLGLAIVKTIVDQHQGTLDVSTSPTGTTFSIALSSA